MRTEIVASLAHNAGQTMHVLDMRGLAVALIGAKLVG